MRDFIFVLGGTIEYQTFFKIFLCAILAGIVGYERENLNKPAGIRTHILLGISGCLVMICSQYLARDNGGIDITRLPAQLLSGIGFMGAGTILKDGSTVKGLTTAASLLCITCVGVLVGAGFYLGAIIATIILYIVLTHVYRFHNGKFHDYKYALKYEDNFDLVKIQEVFKSEKYDVKSIKVDDEDGQIIVRGRYETGAVKSKVVAELIKECNVKEVTEIRG